MKINLLNSFNTYLKALGLIIIIFSSSSAVSAVSYQFEEDFSNSSLPGWKFGQVDFSGVTNVTSEHTFVIENSELVSTGDFNLLKENFVFVQDNTAFGAWSIDVYIPSNLTSSPQTSIMMSKQELGYETLHAIFALHIKATGLTLSATNGDHENHGNDRFMSVSELELDKYQHYDLIRTADRFYVFIDKVMVLNMTFTFDLDSINYFGFVATQGSNAKFDNIQITTDADGLLNEIIEIIEAEERRSMLTIYLTIGSGVVILIVGAVSWQIYKKRRISKQE